MAFDESRQSLRNQPSVHVASVATLQTRLPRRSSLLEIPIPDVVDQSFSSIKHARDSNWLLTRVLNWSSILETPMSMLPRRLNPSRSTTTGMIPISSSSTTAVTTASPRAAVTVDSDPLPLVRRHAMTLATTRGTQHSTHCCGCNSDAAHLRAIGLFDCYSATGTPVSKFDKARPQRISQKRLDAFRHDCEWRDHRRWQPNLIHSICPCFVSRLLHISLSKSRGLSYDNHPMLAVMI